jgi:hypothetical protein
VLLGVCSAYTFTSDLLGLLERVEERLRLS